MRTKGIIYTIASAILFGITPLITTLIYQYGTNSMTVVFFRSLFVIPMLALIMKIKHISFNISLRDLKNIAIIAIFGSGLTTILLFTSYSYIDIGCATTLHFLYPIFVSLLCYFLYKEHLGKRKILSLCMALLGSIFFFEWKQSSNQIGLLLAIASACTYAFYMVQLEKTKLTKLNAYKISFYLAIFILLETLVYQFIFPSITFILPMQAYILIIVLSIISSFLAVILLQKGISYLGSSTASIYCLFEPITSIIVGYLFLQEPLTLNKIIGCVLILSSLVLISREKKDSSSF